MDVTEAIETRLEIREYTDESINTTTKQTILEAGRMAASGRNLQHWRFILIDDPAELTALADVSPSGSWVAGADFAVVICSQYKHGGIDAGRSVTHMQLCAWEHGIGSCIYTVDNEDAYTLLEIPDEYTLELVAGFGYPTTEIEGIKSREPLSEIAYHGTFGTPLDLD